MRLTCRWQLRADRAHFSNSMPKTHNSDAFLAYPYARKGPEGDNKTHLHITSWAWKLIQMDIRHVIYFVSCCIMACIAAILIELL